MVCATSRVKGHHIAGVSILKTCWQVEGKFWLAIALATQACSATRIHLVLYSVHFLTGHLLDKHDRPYTAEFYTGFPAFYQLKSKLYSILAEHLSNAKQPRTEEISVKWIKKPNLEKMIEEDISESQVTSVYL